MKRALRPADVLPAQLARHVLVDEASGCWLWQGAISQASGRPKCQITVNGHKESLPYRAALRWAEGDPLPGMVAAHACNQRICIRPDAAHARWAWPADNTADTLRSGDHAGERHAHRLTEADVRAIRRDWQPPGSRGGRTRARELARRYGVSPHAIYEAAVGRTWRHLPREEDAA